MSDIVERLREALRTHSLRKDTRGYQIWLGETEVKDAADTITDLLAALEDTLPRNLSLLHTNISDDFVVPLETTMGELRATYAAIAKAKGGAS